jgi:small conductance mechanosensitive channel
MLLIHTALLAEPIWLRVSSGWRNDLANWLQHDFPRMLVVLIVAAILVRLLRLVTRKLTQYTQGRELPSGIRVQQIRTLSSVIYSVGLFVICFFALLQILDIVKIDAKPFLASAGVVGLAIGFGAQTLVHDVINGFFILIENAYDIGDTVRLAGVQGTVEQMSMRKTVLRDDTGTVHSVPNSEIKIISNMTRDWAQVALNVAVDYSEPSERVIQLLKEIGSEVRHDPDFGSYLVSEPEVPGIDRVNGNEVDYLLLAKVKPGKQYAIKRELRRRIKDRFEKNNIKAGAPNRMYVVEAPAPTIQS